MKEINQFLPYKLRKRISKTGEARKGPDIYKRRNNRKYRVIIQYKTWINFADMPFKISMTNAKKLSTEANKIYNFMITCNKAEKIKFSTSLSDSRIISSNQNKNIFKENLLNEFENGYVVLITPEEYFGNNYPNTASNLHSRFILGETGFIYYRTKSELEKYPPLYKIWNEVYELNTKGKKFNCPKTWVGEYVLNVKNANPPQISEICKTSKYHNKEKVSTFFKKNYSEITSPPAQTGLGNYDYDYASPKTIDNVKYQMLYLILNSKEEDGSSFFEYIKENSKFLRDKNDTKEDKKKNIKESIEPYKTFFSKNNYLDLAKKAFKKFEKKCQDKGLIDFEKLSEIGAWDKERKLPICPLCGKPIEPHEFFEGIAQAKGREVSDNTQRAIVLMHIDALRPGKLNHRPYNLGWGHNFCNTIQGDKDISETIEELKKIIENYERHNKNNNWKGIK